MDSKGQGALEYLLLIGGAVLIAAVVISLLVSLGGAQQNTARAAGETAGEQINALNELLQ